MDLSPASIAHLDKDPGLKRNAAEYSVRNVYCDTIQAYSLHATMCY